MDRQDFCVGPPQAHHQITYHALGHSLHHKNHVSMALWPHYGAITWFQSKDPHRSSGFFHWVTQTHQQIICHAHGQREGQGINPNK